MTSPRVFNLIEAAIAVVRYYGETEATDPDVQHGLMTRLETAIEEVKDE